MQKGVLEFMTGRETGSEHSTVGMTAIFDAAAEFGLTPDEVVRTVTTTVDHLPGDARACFIDELAGAIAGRLLEKQRGS